MRISWFSCGAASAVACKLDLIKYPNTRLVYQKIWSAHPDNDRFIKDCEKWYGRKIEVIHSPFYKTQFDVIKATRYINGPAGARCTTELKRKVRKYFEQENPGITSQMFGMTYDEVKRADRLLANNPAFEFPLIQAKITKEECYQILNAADIELPVMYKLGFNNNNCIGCVKGGKGYWNMIRKHFPDTFKKMSLLEREIGRSCIKGCFLDTLEEDAGRHKLPNIDCGLLCYKGDLE